MTTKTPEVSAADLDRDARYLYEMAKLRADRDDATRDDVLCAEAALRHWQNLAAVAAMVARNADLKEQEAAALKLAGKYNAELSSIYAELQRVAPWTESNDMEFFDEIMCGLGLLAQERDALAAENKALREAYWKARNAAAGYSNYCPDSANARNCERDLDEAERIFRTIPARAEGRTDGR